jgi:hypothetical protein
MFFLYLAAYRKTYVVMQTAIYKATDQIQTKLSFPQYMHSQTGEAEETNYQISGIAKQ